MALNTQFTNFYFNNIIYQFPDNCEKDAHKVIKTIAKNSFKLNKDKILRSEDYVFDQMIRSFEFRKQKNFSFSINRFLKKLNFKPHFGIYSNWIKQCRKLNYLELASIIFNHFKFNKAIKKNENDYLVLYTDLIAISKKYKRLDLCFFYFQEMENVRIKPNIVCYTILIYMCSEQRKLDLAFFYFNRMKNQGIRPNKSCYCVLMDAFGKAHQPKQVLYFWNQMKNEGLTVDDLTTLSIVVNSLFRDNIHPKELVRALPSLLVRRIKAIQKQGEKEGKFDFHKYSLKLAELILIGYFKNKRDTSPLLLVSGIGKHNKSNKFFTMKSHIIEVIKNYFSEEYSLTVKPVKENLGIIRVLFSKKNSISSLAFSLLKLVNSLSQIKKNMMDL
jgi:pentatricopeptide repeat protein